MTKLEPRLSLTTSLIFKFCLQPGADLGGGGGGGGRRRLPPFLGIRPPADPKGPTFDTFSEIHFWPTDPKIFLKGERVPKKRDFLSKFFKKCPKTAFLTDFSKICLRRINFCQRVPPLILFQKSIFGRWTLKFF